MRRAEGPTFQGEWRTSLGVATIKMEGYTLDATFANPQISPVKGAVKGKTATLKYREGSEARRRLGDARRLRPVVPGWYQYGEGSVLTAVPGTAGARTPKPPREKRAGSTDSG